MPGPLPSSTGLHWGPSCRLETKAWPSQTIVAQHGGDRPASTESWSGDGKATRAGQSGMAATRGNGNVNLDKLLEAEEEESSGDGQEKRKGEGRERKGRGWWKAPRRMDVPESFRTQCVREHDS